MNTGSQSFCTRTLGRTGLTVGPLGVAASFGAGDDAVEFALDHGCNYLYWGSRRRNGFGRGLHHACQKRRHDVVLVIQTYSRLGALVRWSLEWALTSLGTDHADVLLLGWWNGGISESVWEAATRLREQGKARFLAVSTHNRDQAGKWVADSAAPVDIVHVRYNAAHRGAEREVFAHRANSNESPGLVSFTATRWGSLLKPHSGIARIPTAADCYRFVLSQPAVDVCLTGPRNLADMRQAVSVLERAPMDDDELAWMRSVGDYVYARRLIG